MRYEIRKDPRNRIYFRPPEGILVPGQRYDGEMCWLGLATAGTCQRVEQIIDDLVAQRDQLKTAREAYNGVKDQVVPADYRRRHGSLLGGTVCIDGDTEEIIPPTFGELRKAQWEQVADVVLRVGSTGSCAGRTMDSLTLYRASLTDGRFAYREVGYYGFGDDLRETYWLPPDLYAAVVGAEIRARGITVQSAREWLDKYRGCVDTELYEAAVELAG